MDGPPFRPRFSARARALGFRHAGRGLARLLRDEHNAWLHLAATLAAAAVGILLRASASDWRWLVLAAALVWSAEALNTAVEELSDRLHPGRDPAIGRVKDLAAGAVLVAAVAAALIGLLTLVPLIPEALP